MAAAKGKKLVVAAQGGLCNRLRVVLSVLAFARGRGDVACEVVWNATRECRARFDELFEPVEAPSFCIREGRWAERPVTRANLHLPGLLRRLAFDGRRKNYRPDGTESLQQLVDSHRNVYVSTCYHLFDYGPAELAALRLRPALQQRVERLCASFGGRPVGVHIRRTDHRVAIEASPVGAFLTAMDRELKERPDTVFFLATDDEEVKSRLCGRYAERIMVQTIAENRRDSLAGMESAVVDLWALARTQKILGSYWSSFTDTAAELGHVPLEIIRQDKQR